MGFVRDSSYTRGEIAAELGIAEDAHAVLLAKGEVLAIVVAANGHHPSGKRYKNSLSATTFIMHGEKDERGKRLEQSARAVPLFYAHASDGLYRYEGEVRWVKTTDYGDPFREFARVSG